MYEAALIGAYLLSPLSVVMLLGLLASVLAALRRHRAALIAAVTAFACLWIASMPVTALTLVGELESRHPPQPIEELPRADAIVVLGGALLGAYPPRRPSFIATAAATRVWHAAALYHAGKAPVIIVAAGNRSHNAKLQPEAEAIGEMLQGLGVPAPAMRLEGHSRNTRENAEQALEHLRDVQAKSVLLVTSAIHMDRAMNTFELKWKGTGLRVIPAATDYRVIGNGEGLALWLPTASSLGNVTAAIKEFAGKLVLGIIE